MQHLWGNRATAIDIVGRNCHMRVTCDGSACHLVRVPKWLNPGCMIKFVMGNTLVPDSMKRFLRLVLAAIAMLCAVTAAPAMAAGKKVALIIGNSTYNFAQTLPNPGNDADRVAAAARQAGFDVTIAKDLGQMQFRATLREFRAKAEGAEIALLYYAGHGIEKDNANYLIPVDAKLADPIDLRDEGIDLALVVDNLSRAERRIILLDACRDNPFKEHWAEATRSFFSTGLGAMNPPDNSLVVFAAAAGMKALDGTSGNSNFAIAISEQIVKPGMELREFGPAVKDAVKTASGGQQIPYYLPTLDSTKVYFIPPALQVNDESTQDELDWARAKATGTADSYRLYKRAHPNGRHFDAAQERLDDLLVSSGSATAPRTPQPQPQPQPAYVPPANSQTVVGPVSQAPEISPTSTPATQSPQVVQQPASSAPVYGPTAPPIVSNPAPQAQPQPAPVFTQQSPAPAPTTQSPAANFPPAQTQTTTYSLPPAQTPITQSPAVSVPQASAQSGTYVAPPIQRRYGMGGFPVMPDPPVFDYGPYPTCKDTWQSVTDAMAKVQATIDCKKAFTAYKSNWLNKYREAMNSYSAAIGEIYTNEVAPPHYPTREAEVQQFYSEMRRRVDGVLDGGFLMADHAKANARFDADFAAVIDSYNRSTGCKGYPTPAGLAPNPNC